MGCSSEEKAGDQGKRVGVGRERERERQGDAVKRRRKGGREACRGKARLKGKEENGCWLMIQEA